MTRRWRSQAGSTDVIALVWLAPALLAAACLIVAAGRVSATHQQLAHASEAAAQAAALARTSTQATRDAQTIAAATLTDAKQCPGGPTVTTDTRNFRAGGTVTVSVSCTVARDDLYGPFAPGTQRITDTSTASIDTYKGIGP